MQPLYNPTTGVTATPTANTTVQQQQAAQGQGFTPNLAPVITPGSLTNNVIPVTVPPSTPVIPQTNPIVTAPTGTTIDTTGNAVISTPTSATTPVPSKMDTFLGSLASLGNRLSTKGDVTAQLQQENQLANKTQDAAKSYNAYVQAKQEAEMRQQTIFDNKSGMTAESVSGVASDTARRDNANVANLAIQAQASQGLLEAAQKTINDKLDAQFKPIQEQIDFATKYAQTANNNLTDSEKVQLQAKIQKDQTDAAALQAASKDIHDRLLQNNAPTAVYSALDKITNDYTSGKITAQDAQNKMYAATQGYGSVNKYTSVNGGYDVNGNPINVAFDTTTGKYANGSNSLVQNNGLGNNNGGTPTPVSFEQYGLLSKTSFNPDVRTDQRALNYLNAYLTGGQIPTGTQIGISSRGQQSNNEFEAASKRAKDLYFAATNQPLPTPQIIANNIKLINTNNGLANKLQTQEQTVSANTDLSLANMTKSGLNSSNFGPLNGLIDTVKSAFNDPNVGQFLSQNATIQNELGSLLAVKNASGTTVYDKLQSAGIINPTDTPEVIQRKVSTIIKEAGNFTNAITKVNGDLYKKIDPLMTNPDNPNRQATINVNNSHNPVSATINSSNTTIINGTVTFPNGSTWTPPTPADLEKFKSDHGL